MARRNRFLVSVMWAFVSVATSLLTGCGPDIQDVRRANDPTELAKIATQASDSWVRVAAIEKIEDQALLAQFALEQQDADVRTAAVQKLTNQVGLAKLAVEARDTDVRRAAAAKLTDQVLLAKVATEDKAPEVGGAAVKNLNDQSLLGKVAVASKHPNVRFHAVRKLTDQTLLGRIAAEDADADVRHCALLQIDVSKLSDQPLLANLAVEAKNPDVRRAALAKLTDPAQLARIAMWTKPDVTKTVKDPALLARIAVEAQDQPVRLAAATNLTDQALLADLLAKHKDLDVRYALVAQLDDQRALGEIALEDHDFRARHAAVEKLTDQAVLYAIANNRPFSSGSGTNRFELPPAMFQFAWASGTVAAKDDAQEIRRVAVTKLTAQTLLGELARQCQDVEIRRAAIQALTDQSVLAAIAEQDRSSEMRIAAIGRITDQRLLSSWAQGSPQAAIRQAAIARIADDDFLLKRLAVEPSSSVRGSIVRTLHGKDGLRQVALTAYHAEDRKEALTRLQATFPDAVSEVTLAQRALEHQLAVIGQENDQAKLLKMALAGEFDVIQVAAAQRLDDTPTLEQVLISSTNRVILRIVLSKVQDKGALDRVAAGAADPAVRLAAPVAGGTRSWRQVFDAATARGASVKKVGDALAAVSLFSSVQGQAKEAVQQACLNMIRLGDESRIPEMAELLEGYGDKTLAEDYLNCGQPDLDTASRDWASRRGYSVGTGVGSHRARWGSGR